MGQIVCEILAIPVRVIVTDNISNNCVVACTMKLMFSETVIRLSIVTRTLTFTFHSSVLHHHIWIKCFNCSNANASMSAAWRCSETDSRAVVVVVVHDD